MKKILTSSTAQVTCCFVGLGGFVTIVINLPCENSIFPKKFHAQGGHRISLYFLRYEIEIRLRAVYLIVSCLKGWTGGFRFFIDTKKDLSCADRICMIDIKYS